MIDINSKIKNKKNVVFLCRNTDPVEFTIDLLKAIPKKTKVLYVSVNKSYSVLADRLTGEKINFSDWHFIDCISSSLLMATKSTPKCLYLPSPKSLVDLAMAIDDHLDKVDLVVFDNISGLLVFNGTVPTLQLLNSLMAKIRGTKSKALYLLFHDTSNEVMEDLALFADKVEVV